MNIREVIRQKFKTIQNLKLQLKCSDYQAIKFAEGVITAEEYAPIKAQRQSWRDEINALEAEIKALRERNNI